MEREAVDVADGWVPRVAVPLDWTEVDGVFFLAGQHRQHVVSPVGVFLLELANGRHTVAEMVAVVREAFRLDMSPEDAVRIFLAQARRDGLVG